MFKLVNNQCHSVAPRSGDFFLSILDRRDATPALPGGHSEGSRLVCEAPKFRACGVPELVK